MSKKNYTTIIGIGIILLFILIFNMNNNKMNQSEILNNDNLLISIDGNNSDTLPTTGIYYLTSYECDGSNTRLVWDVYSHKLSVSNGRRGGDISCNVEFKSRPKLAEMPIGSYVAYVGDGGTVGSTRVSCQKNGAASSYDNSVETEAPNSCYGQNAREDLDENRFVYAYGYSGGADATYGYCYSSGHKYHTTGWRIAYIDSNNKPVIVSAGSPECNFRTGSEANITYIQTANAKALKYCNTAYVDGNCTCGDSDHDGLCDSASSDAWAINDTDFYNITKAISGVGKRLAEGSSELGDVGGVLGETLYCYEKSSYPECGYHNDLIDNGGYYWFASYFNLQSGTTSGVGWFPNYHNVFFETESYNGIFGLRPVISLSSTVYVTGGTGTMEDPYSIDK